MQEQPDITHPVSSPDTQSPDTQSPNTRSPDTRSLVFNNRPDLRRTDVAPLRAMLEKTVSNPQAHYFKNKIDKFERSYAYHLEQTRMFISRPNQVPGYRTFIIIGPGIRYPNDYYTSVIDVIAVTADRRLVMESIIGDFGTDSSVSSIIATFNRLISGKFNEGEKSGIFGCPLDLSGVKTIYSQNCGQELDLEPFLHNPYICGKISEIINREIKNHLTLAYDTLCNALDRDVLTTILDTGILSFEQGKWLTGGDGVSREIILARQQAVHAYPILATYFSADVYNSMHQAIDNRTSLSDAIAIYFETDTCRVKRLQGLTWQHAATVPNGPKLSSRIQDILEFPEGTVPKTPDQFRKLDIIREFGRFVFSTGLCDTMRRLSEHGNPWRFIDRIEQTSGRNVVDAIDFLIRKLYIPAAINKIDAIVDHDGNIANFISISESDTSFADHFLNEIRAIFKPGQLLDWSERYHRNIARYEDRLDTVSSEQTWPGFFDSIDFGNGCIARELTSAQALRIQGKVENHCIGGYLSKVLSGESRDREFTLIFSIEKNNVIRSTAEIKCVREADLENPDRISHLHARVQQNLAHSNKDPSDDAVRTADRIVEKLKTVDSDTCQAYLDGLNRARLEYARESDIEEHIRFCGFDPLDRTMMERAWEELSLALPRSRRKEGLGKFIDRTLIDKSIWRKVFGNAEVSRIQNAEISRIHQHDQGQVDDRQENILNRIPDTTSRVNTWDRIDGHGRFIDPEQQLDSRSEGIAEHDWQ